MVIRLSNAIPSSQTALQVLFQEVAGFSFLWQDDINAQYAKFLSRSPNLSVLLMKPPANLF